MTLPRPLSAALAAICAAVLPACDGFNLQEIKPGISTSAEVRARMGPPANEYSNADGSFTWEYNRQPGGVECHMITFGPDQVVRKVEQVLTEANFAKVKEGMSKDEVLRLLGRPGSIKTFPGLQEEVWDWRIATPFPTEEAHFHVHFTVADGLVKRTTRKAEPKG